MTPEVWALLLVGAAILWQGGAIVDAVRLAAAERRKDHEDLIDAIEKLSHDVGFIETYVGGIESKVNPPDLSDYD